MNKEIEILTPNGIKTINQGKLFIIAEVGNQFGGKLEKALRLCEAAKEAGADAVKFIFWFPDEILADKTQLYRYIGRKEYKAKRHPSAEDNSWIDFIYHKTEEMAEPMFDLLNRLRLTFQEWAEVKEYCDKLDIIMTATVLSPSGIDWAGEDGLCLPIIKLSSWDWNFYDLWDWAGKMQLPLIIDTAPVTQEEFDRNMKLLKDNRNENVVLLHCVHTKSEAQTNLLAIPYMRERYDCLVGYSAPDLNDDLDFASVALGACVIEKRLTLDRKGGVLHDAVSKEPSEFGDYVSRMRLLKTKLGKEQWAVSDNDWLERKKWFRRIVADEDILKGDSILRPMLEAKRGETGLSPFEMWNIVGKVAKRDIKRNDDIKPEDA